MTKFKYSHLQVKEGEIQTWSCAQFFPYLALITSQLKMQKH